MSGLEEILFENRNKSYGAYQLRKKANKYLIVGFVLSFSIMLVTVATLFVILNSDLFFPEKYPENIGIEAMQLADLEDYRFPEPPKAQEKSIADLTKPEIVDSTLEEKQKPASKKAETASNDSINKKGADSNIDGKGDGISGDSLFIKVDKIPVFIGGTPELTKYLRKNLMETSKKCRNRVRVIVKFQVSRIGEVQNVTIISGVSPDIDNEVLKVVRMSPRWEPAQQSGHPIPAWLTLPINL